MFELSSTVNHVLVAVLNWGLGHASRSSVIIQELIEKNKTVTIASNGTALSFLHNEFPSLNFIELPAYKIRYESNSFLQTMLSNSSNIISAIKKEKKTIDNIIEDGVYDMIISDCRFGAYSDKLPSVLISHQIKLMTPFKTMDLAVNKVYSSILSKFNEVWIPDYEDSRLSGALSQKDIGTIKKFIGPLSSLKKEELQKEKGVAIILSGPEPARTKFEDRLINELKDIDEILLVRGSEEEGATSFNNTWTILNIADRTEINKILNQYKVIISRSGYSSIMDYYKLGRDAIMIPTPNQTEQGYLAEVHNRKNGFVCLNEDDLSGLKQEVMDKLATS